jgi:hypothetical protein
MHGAIFVTIEIQNQTCIIDTFCRVNRVHRCIQYINSICDLSWWYLTFASTIFLNKVFLHLQLYILLLLRFGRTFHFLHMDFLRKGLFLYNYDVNKSINIFHLVDYCSYICDVYIVTSGAVVSSD